MRLNGWQRIGVVLSVLWLTVFLLWGLNDYLNGFGAFIQTIPGETVVIQKGTAGHCTQTDPAPSSTAGQSIFEMFNGHTDESGRYCLTAHFVEGAKEITHKRPDRQEFLLRGLLLVAVVPTLIAWFLAYLCIFCVRWIARGFKPKS